MGIKQRGISTFDIPTILWWTCLCPHKVCCVIIAESNPQYTPLIHIDQDPVSVGILAKKAGNINVINIPKWLINWNWKIENPKIYREYNTIHTYTS